MDFYIEREMSSDLMDTANKCADGILHLWGRHYLDSGGEENIFFHQFSGNDIILKREYLFAMDYLSDVLTAYKHTGKKIYQDVFEKFLGQFYEYLQKKGPVYDDLPVYAQTLLLIKAMDILGSVPHQRDFLELLYRYAAWLMDREHYKGDNNHGMFQNIALLHLSVFLKDRPEAPLWETCAAERINQLFKDTYYSDFTNIENSIRYFDYNNELYKMAIRFCEYYGISGMAEIAEKLKQSDKALITMAHKDHSFPLIGDGCMFSRGYSNEESRLFPDMGFAVLKVKETYLSFKCKTVYQSHAHMDVSGITARYKGVDFIIDTGQYNYDRYTPINRYVRSSAGHSGIFPLFADNLFLDDFCHSLKNAGITAYMHQGNMAFVRGEYCLKDVAVRREIFVFRNKIIIKDHWNGKKSAVMRQRFVIPKTLLGNAKFTVSRKILESWAGNIRFRFEIISDLPDVFTAIQFGIAAPQYDSYEETMVLDTFAENALSGEITAKITFWEEGIDEETKMHADG